jgi:hypothetical protein
VYATLPTIERRHHRVTGGRDGHLFPVPLKVYDESLAFLRRALDAAKLGPSEKLHGFARLDTLAKLVE